VAAETDVFDLASLKLAPGEGRRLLLKAPIAAFDFGGERYDAEPKNAAVTIDVSRMSGNGYALKLAFKARLNGPCMRCLKEASPVVDVQAREVSVPGEDEELSSPYVTDERLDVAAWAHDALALAAPEKVLCKEDCLGLCAECAADLNEAGPEHAHERAPDRRWAKLGELKLE
jgi:uncharacterized protein